MKLILVHLSSMSKADVVADYLPSNYRIVAKGDEAVLVAGTDDHGWTADGYVLPRLGSGLIRAEVIGQEDPDSAAPLLAWLAKHGGLHLRHDGNQYDLVEVEAPPAPPHMTIPPLRVQVIADSSGTWAGNQLEFDDLDESVAYAKDLFSRWMSTTDWRVIDAEDFVIRQRGDGS